MEKDEGGRTKGERIRQYNEYRHVLLYTLSSPLMHMTNAPKIKGLHV